MVEFYGDYHTHTNNSDAEQTLDELVEAARGKGLKEVAVTDHGPLAAVIGVKSADTYLKLREDIDILNKKYDDITILLGAEANIRDDEGSLDIPSEVIKEMDILLAGLHPYTLPSSISDGIEIFVQNSLRHLGKGQREKAITANTKACVAAIENNPELDILSHPGLFFKVDIEEVARACIKHEVLFEINCGHDHPDLSDIIKVDKLGGKFIVNSDAHYPYSVGNLEYGKWVIRKLNLDEDKVVNALSGGGHQIWAKKAKTYTYS